MGADPTSYTDGYLQSGEIPNFRILDMSLLELFMMQF